jgi:hypothetical protein
VKDSAGNERTDEQVKELVRRTLRDMSRSEVAELVIDGWGLAGLPPDLTRCPCHDLWYDECEVYGSE